jgi:hypothetical protein
MPKAFNGTLGTNLIMGSLFNMIISQQVFADNIKVSKKISRERDYDF